MKVLNSADSALSLHNCNTSLANYVKTSAPSQHLSYTFSALVKNSNSVDSAPFLHNFTYNFFAHYCL